MVANVHQMFNQDQRDRRALVDYLFDRKDWTTAREIRRDISMSPLRVRQLAQEFPAMLVSSTMGYKLRRNATHDEVVECVQSLIERAQKIIDRASQLAGTT